MNPELITGLASGMSNFDAFVISIRALFMLLGFLFLAMCWFLIARRTGTGGAWLAFIPLIGMIVPWRIAQAPLWMLIIGMITALLFPVMTFIGFAAMIVAFALILTPVSNLPPDASLGPIIAFAVIGVLLALITFAAYLAITAYLNARAAKAIGFSIWVGLLASPLTTLIPFGFVVRLVFVGILAFKKEPF